MPWGHEANEANACGTYDDGGVLAAAGTENIVDGKHARDLRLRNNHESNGG